MMFSSSNAPMIEPKTSSPELPKEDAKMQPKEQLSALKEQLQDTRVVLPAVREHLSIQDKTHDRLAALVRSVDADAELPSAYRQAA